MYLKIMTEIQDSALCDAKCFMHAEKKKELNVAASIE